MKKKCVCAGTSSELTFCSPSARKTLQTAKHLSPSATWALFALACSAMFTFSGPVSAQQTVVIEINVVGLNTNQLAAQTQLATACESLDGNTSAQAIALQDTCNLINSLNPNDPDNPNQADDARRLKEITDAVAPEEIFAINDSLVALSDFQTTNVHARLNILRSSQLSDIYSTPVERDEEQKNDTNEPQEEKSASLGNPFTPSGSLNAGGSASGDLIKRLGGFINGHASSGDFNGSEFQQDSDMSSGSLTLGSDYRFTDNIIAGVGAGFLQDSASFSNVRGGADTEGFNLTAFGTWYVVERGYVDVVLDVGQAEHDLERSVSINSDASLLATSSPSSTATSLTFSAGRNFKPFGWDLGGYGRISLTRAKISSYRESLKTPQASFAALYAVDDQTVNSTTMTVGVELSKAISTSRAVILPLLRIEYVTENQRSKDNIDATLITTGTAAQYKGDDRVADYINLGVGASAVLRGGRNVYAYYETHIQHDLIAQDWLKAGIRLEF